MTHEPIGIKIQRFINEVGGKPLNTEQSKVFAAFTKTKGRPVTVRTSDSGGDNVSFKIDPSKREDGPQHILKKHYKETKGRVTAMEILNMCEAVRKGDKELKGNCICYLLHKTYNGVTYTICIKIGRKDNYLKTFYSNRGYDKKKKGISHPVVSRKGHPRK